MENKNILKLFLMIAFSVLAIKVIHYEKLQRLIGETQFTKLSRKAVPMDWPLNVREVGVGCPAGSGSSLILVKYQNVETGQFEFYSLDDKNHISGLTDVADSRLALYPRGTEGLVSYFGLLEKARSICGS